MDVTLVDHTQDPLKALYIAFKGAYSKLSAVELAGLEHNRRDIARYIQARLDVAHTSPLQFVDFTFSIAGLSRAAAQQLTRHHVGISFSMQSQRYVRFEDDHLVVVPKSIRDSVEHDDGWEEYAPDYQYHKAISAAKAAYQTLTSGDGAARIPAEDARYALPLGTASNLLMKINFAALLHVCDERLCTQAQWEIRKLFALIKNLVEGVEPLLGNMLGPKCMPQRGGVCTESYKAWEACPIGKVRPHKILLENWTTAWKEKRLAEVV